MQITMKECCMALATAQDILILCHKSPDGDTLGSAFGLYYALTGLGKRVAVDCSDPLPQKFAYFYPQKPFEDFTPQFIVAVDVADEQLLGEKLDCYRGQVDLCIDHHISNTDFAKGLLLESKAAATAQVVSEVITGMGITLEPAMASALYTGIATDTGCFRYQNTTAQTHRAAALLIEAGVDQGMINTLLFETKSRARVALERRTMETLEMCFEERCALVHLSQAMLAETGALEEDIDGISAIPRQIEGVVVAVTVREREAGKYKLSLRSARGFNASKVCRRLGGGGHAAAAGCVLEGSFAQVREQILAEVRTELEGMA